MGRGGNGDGELDVGRMRSSGSSRKKPTPVQLQRDVVRLEDGLLELHGWVTNPNGYKMARPNLGPIGGIARRAARREGPEAGTQSEPTARQLETQIIRLEDGLLELYEGVTNPRGYKMARPNLGPIGGIARRAARRENPELGTRRKNLTARELESHIIRLEGGLLELYERVVNPNGHKMARPRRGPIGGIARRAAKRETKD